ncbi:methylated-DNA--[protein]-cysteine S-methyltransferase [Paenibacillus filicis]|uniref:Methylated-DNA--protein-cysteine methyltransferase n=1 Tax=Paenibacillus gyeongsangnamensis TaxID=3388067 RepID=A0ABT4QBE5_9BACL|nr:methylated-DNA--[protein]-cysteine S-methyltransferase [Paenibacillus filicis]MCZ8514138.1 methylated-DNA--[protein]-cysteine S-methyltransferase [Paenibacillus filicis]
MSIRYDELATPIGALVLASSGSKPGQGLCHIEFGGFKETSDRLTAWSERWYGTREWLRDPQPLAAAAEQLTAYFAGSLDRFDLALDLQGTPFQRKVWTALLEVPFGEACSYKDIGIRIGSPKAVRAIGGANNRNPVPIIVPCHRVIGADGSMVGYGGGLSIKTFLLQHEGFPLKGRI